MPGISAVKVRTRSFVDGTISLSDLSDWLALNFWTEDVPDFVHDVNHLVADLDAGLIDEVALRSELAAEVGAARTDQVMVGTTSSAIPIQVKSNFEWAQLSVPFQSHSVA